MGTQIKSSSKKYKKENIKLSVNAHCELTQNIKLNQYKVDFFLCIPTVLLVILLVYGVTKLELASALGAVWSRIGPSISLSFMLTKPFYKLIKTHSTIIVRVQFLKKLSQILHKELKKYCCK